MLMRKILRSINSGGLRQVIFLMIATMGVLGLVPNLSEAGVMPAGDINQAAAVRADNEAKIKAVLERKEIAARLSDYGLTPQEVSSRLNELTDRQVAEIAGQIDQINAGGDAAGLLLSLIVLILVVLLVLYLLGYVDLGGLLKKKPKPAPKP